MIGADLTPVLLLLISGTRGSSSDLVETLLTASDQLSVASRAALGVGFAQRRAHDKERDETRLADELGAALTAVPGPRITEDQLAQLPALKRVVDRLPALTRDRVVAKAPVTPVPVATRPDPNGASADPQS